MNTEYDWNEQNYDETFEKACIYVDNRRKTDKDFSIKTLEDMLETMYVRRGNDWVGKGPLKNIEDSATIAAFEHKLAEWKKEIKK